MYIEGVRIRPSTYRFKLPEGVEHDNVLFVMSKGAGVLTPSDYDLTTTDAGIEIRLHKDVPAAGGMITVYGFVSTPIRKPASKPKTKA